MAHHTELDSDQAIHEWHDQAFARYQHALDEHQADTDSLAKKSNYAGARAELTQGVQYWRRIGEAVAVATNGAQGRTGIEVKNFTHPDGTPMTAEERHQATGAADGGEGQEA